MVVPVLLVVLLGAAGAIAWWRWPMLLPGSHAVSVYTVDDSLSGPPQSKPGLLGRLMGLCDADTHYVTAGTSRLCLVIGGPFGEVEACRGGGHVTVDAKDTPTLRTVAQQDHGSPETTTRLVLAEHGRPVAIIMVANLASQGPVTGTALD